MKIIEFCLSNVCEDYRLGNNKYVEGVYKIREVQNEAGVALRYEISQDVLTAKEYFQRGRVNIEKGCASNIESIKRLRNLFLRAFIERIEGINVMRGVFYEDSGTAKDLSSKRYDKAEILTGYKKELEKGAAKIKMANEYFINGLEELKNIVDNMPISTYQKQCYDLVIAEKKGYYTDASPDQFDDYVSTAKSALMNEDLYTAIINYTKALRIKPDDAEINFNIGNIYMGNYDFNRAFNYLNKSLEAGYDDPLLHIQLGFIYKDKGYEKCYDDDFNLIKEPDSALLERAISEIKRGLLKLNEERDNEIAVMAYRMLGLIYKDRKNYSESSKAYEKVISLSREENYLDYDALGDIYRNIDVNKSIKYYKEAIRVADKENEDAKSFIRKTEDKIREVEKHLVEN